jgi:pimeloyl-ACP methyl ester carboxylesterase
MKPTEAALIAKIAYLDPYNGQIEASRLGYSFEMVQNGSVYCWVGRKKYRTVVGFRGSTLRGAHRRNLRINMETELVPWLGPGLVHKGYYRAFWRIINSLRDVLTGHGRLEFVGHSMGAAIALLCALKIGCHQVICFASPKVGNEEFADKLTKTCRILRYENKGDLLTKYPVSGYVTEGRQKIRHKYKHAGRAIRLQGFSHSMDAYIDGTRKRL